MKIKSFCSKSLGFTIIRFSDSLGLNTYITYFSYCGSKKFYICFQDFYGN